MADQFPSGRVHDVKVPHGEEGDVGCLGNRDSVGQSIRLHPAEWIMKVWPDSMDPQGNSGFRRTANGLQDVSLHLLSPGRDGDTKEFLTNWNKVRNATQHFEFFFIGHGC